jgi:heptosyltransferase-1
MSAPLKRLSNPHRILIVRLGAMGDVIHALPAVAAIRRAWPQAEIGWVIEERWLELLATRGALEAPRSQQKPLVDRIYAVNTKAWRSALFSDETWKEMLAVRRAIRSGHPEVALDFQGAWKSGVIAGLSGAPLRIGFRQPRERAAAMFYTHRVIATKSHVIEQNFELVEHLGIAADFTRVERTTADVFPRSAATESWCDAVLRNHAIESAPFAIMNPGAGWGAKCWPPEKYAEVIRGLADLGVRTLVNFGPAEEPLAREVESLTAGAARAIVCSIGELIELTRRASLFVGGDTGPMHLAAALRVPVAGIFGPTDPARNGPFGTASVVLRSAASVTNHSRRAAPDEAMLGIPAADVLAAAQRLLLSSPSPQPSSSLEAPDA